MSHNINVCHSREYNERNLVKNYSISLQKQDWMPQKNASKK